jgi:hypothetical protein
MRSEKSITASIMRWLKTQPDVYAWKTVGTVFGRNGIPDICGNVGTVSLYLEVKTITGKVSPRQAVEHERIRRSGGRVFVVRSLGEAQFAVGTLRSTGRTRSRGRDEKGG